MSRRAGALVALLLVQLIGGGATRAGSAVQVPVASNLQRDAQAALAGGQVLLVLVSRSDCGYCQVLKREIIRPMIRSGAYDSKVIIRELLLDQPGVITDFDGTATRAAAIAARYKETLTPTVLFLSPAGTELTRRRRGLTTLEFYGHYLDRAIDQALLALQ